MISACSLPAESSCNSRWKPSRGIDREAQAQGDVGGKFLVQNFPVVARRNQADALEQVVGDRQQNGMHFNLLRAPGER